MSKEAFLAIVDFIVTKNEQNEVEAKVLETGLFDSSGFDAINRKYYEEGKPQIIDKTFTVLEREFDDIFVARGPYTQTNSWKKWYNQFEEEGIAVGLEGLQKTHQKLQFYTFESQSQNGIIWLFPLANSIDGACYAKAYLLNQTLQQKKSNSVVAMASPGCVAMARNKGILKHMLEESHSALMPPTCLIDLKKMDRNQIETFLSQSKTDYFIFKPTNATLSEGIFLVKKEDVLLAVEALKAKDREKLTQILKKYGTPEAFVNKAKSWEGAENKLKDICTHWMEDKDNFVLLQSFCFAATIHSNEDKMYSSSKGRAVILVKDNKPHTIDIFFHAQKVASDEKNQFNYTQCVVGGNVETEYFNPDATLYEKLSDLFQRELPIVFEKACHFNFQTALLEAIKNEDESKMRYLLTSGKSLFSGPYTDEYREVLQKNISTSSRGLLFLDFLVNQTRTYYLGNEEEERGYHRPLFDLLRPHLSLLNVSQIELLKSTKYFVLNGQGGSAPPWAQKQPTEEFINFFKYLESQLEKRKSAIAFSLSVKPVEEEIPEVVSSTNNKTNSLQFT